jgi:hypothetical protein
MPRRTAPITAPSRCHSLQPITAPIRICTHQPHTPQPLRPPPPTPRRTRCSPQESRRHVARPSRRLCPRRRLYHVARPRRRPCRHVAQRRWPPPRPPRRPPLGPRTGSAARPAARPRWPLRPAVNVHRLLQPHGRHGQLRWPLPKRTPWVHL